MVHVFLWRGGAARILPFSMSTFSMTVFCSEALWPHPLAEGVPLMALQAFGPSFFRKNHRKDEATRYLHVSWVLTLRCCLDLHSNMAMTSLKPLKTSYRGDFATYIDSFFQWFCFLLRSKFSWLCLRSLLQTIKVDFFPLTLPSEHGKRIYCLFSEMPLMHQKTVTELSHSHPTD